MKKSVILAAATTFLGFSAVVEAKTSSPTEFRGYSQCVSAAAEESKGLVTSRYYYIDKNRTNMQYYVNGTRWQDGERAEVRVACETNRRGFLVSHSIEQGQFNNDPGRVTVEIAQN